MSGLPAASVVCAFVAALLFACAAVAQQSAAAQVGADDGLISTLIRTPRWWAGVVGDGGGYAMQAVALALGSVLVVQPILVSSLVFALPLAARYAGRRVTATTWALAATLTAALATFLIVGNPTEGGTRASFGHWAAPLIALLIVIGLCAAFGLGPLSPQRRALLLGTASGLLYGVAAAVTKHVTSLLDKGLPTILGSWQLWMLIASGLAGVYLQQRAFQVGPLAASLPAVTIAEPLAAVFLGMTVLDERLRTDSLGIAATIIALLVMGATTIALSNQQAHIENSPDRESTADPAVPT